MTSKPTDIHSLLDWLPNTQPDLRNQEFHNRQHALGGSTLGQQTPINEYDALMRTAPGDEPEPHEAVLQQLREVVAEAIDSLGERHRFVINAIHSERLSYGELAERMSLSKSMTHKLVKQAETALRVVLAEHPIIKEYLT